MHTSSGSWHDPRPGAGRRRGSRRRRGAATQRALDGPRSRRARSGPRERHSGPRTAAALLQTARRRVSARRATRPARGRRCRCAATVPECSTARPRPGMIPTHDVRRRVEPPASAATTMRPSSAARHVSTPRVRAAPVVRRRCGPRGARSAAGPLTARRGRRRSPRAAVAAAARASRPVVRIGSRTQRPDSGHARSDPDVLRAGQHARRSLRGWGRPRCPWRPCGLPAASVTPCSPSASCRSPLPCTDPAGRAGSGSVIDASTIPAYVPGLVAYDPRTSTGIPTEPVGVAPAPLRAPAGLRPLRRRRDRQGRARRAAGGGGPRLDRAVRGDRLADHLRRRAAVVELRDLPDHRHARPAPGSPRR